MWLAFAGAVIVLPRLGGDAPRGLERIVAWQGLADGLALASDFDGDGYGLAGRTIDPAPFDAGRHPLALCGRTRPRSLTAGSLRRSALGHTPLGWP